jgi:hypothetical protein
MLEHRFFNKLLNARRSRLFMVYPIGVYSVELFYGF